MYHELPFETLGRPVHEIIRDTIIVLKRDVGRGCDSWLSRRTGISREAIYHERKSYASGRVSITMRLALGLGILRREEVLTRCLDLLNRAGTIKREIVRRQASSTFLNDLGNEKRMKKISRQ